MLQWRNSKLDFASIGALQASLATTPREQGLTRAPVAEDIQVLDHAARIELAQRIHGGLSDDLCVPKILFFSHVRS